MRIESRWSLWLVILVAVLARISVAYVFAGQLRDDPDAYVALAESLSASGIYGLPQADGEVRPTAFRPPGLPWLLSWFVIDGHLSPISIALFQLVCGIVTVLASWRIALLLRLSPLLPALVVALDPILLMQSAQPMTEPAAAACAALGWWGWLELVDRGRPSSRPARYLACGLFGVFLGGCVLLRPTFLIWALGLIGYLAVYRLRDWRNGLAAAAICCGLALPLGGWMLRNQRVLGEPVWGTTHGGYTLLLANNPVHYDQLSVDSVWRAWDSDPFFRLWEQRWQGDPAEAAFWDQGAEREPGASAGEEADELVEDERAYRAAKATIGRDPWSFVASCGIRLARLWTPLPLAVADRQWWLRSGVAAFYVFLYLLVGRGLWRLGFRRLFGPRWVPVLGIVLTLSLLHAVYWSNMRMRTPATVSLAIVAAVAVTRRADVV